MKNTFILTLLVFLLKTCPSAFAQEFGEPSIYKGHGKLIRLNSKVLDEGKSDTFYLSSTEIVIENGDTVKSKRVTYKFIHRLDSIKKGYLIQTLWVGKQFGNEMLYTKNCPELLLKEDFFKIYYKTPLLGGTDSITILNCPELALQLGPLYKQKMLCERDAEPNKESFLHKINIDGYTDQTIVNCFLIDSWMKRAIASTNFESFYQELVPSKKGEIRYKAKVQLEKPGPSLTLYKIVSLKKTKKGNSIYDISEDTTMVAPAFVRAQKSMGGVEAFFLGGKKSKDAKPIFEADEKTHIELDRNKTPIRSIHSSYNRVFQNGLDRKTFQIFKIETQESLSQ